MVEPTTAKKIGPDEPDPSTSTRTARDYAGQAPFGKSLEKKVEKVKIVAEDKVA